MQHIVLREPKSLPAEHFSRPSPPSSLLLDFLLFDNLLFSSFSFAFFSDWIVASTEWLPQTLGDRHKCYTQAVSSDEMPA